MVCIASHRYIETPNKGGEMAWIRKVEQNIKAFTPWKYDDNNLEMMISYQDLVMAHRKTSNPVVWAETKELWAQARAEALPQALAPAAHRPKTYILRKEQDSNSQLIL
jgi:hypothetical protein